MLGPWNEVMVNLPGGRHPRTDRDKKVAVDVADGLGPSRGSGAFRQTREMIVAQRPWALARVNVHLFSPATRLSGAARNRRYTVALWPAQSGEGEGKIR